MEPLTGVLAIIKQRRDSLEREITDVQNELQKKATAFRELCEIQYKIEKFIEDYNRMRESEVPQG